MAKKYKIVVDGIEHIVEVEDYNGASPRVQSVAPAAQVVTSTTNEVSKEAPVNSATPTDNSILAPLQGNLQDVKVTVGQSVKAGDLLVIIEAMKMENEVVAPKDGKVVAIHCQKGTKVNSGDPLLDIA